MLYSWGTGLIHLSVLYLWGKGLYIVCDIPVSVILVGDGANTPIKNIPVGEGLLY